MTERTPNYQTTATVDNSFIILDKYDKLNDNVATYQTESALEAKFIADLQAQGYEYLPNLTDATMLENVRVQLSELNNATFTDNEWARFVNQFLAPKSDTIIDATYRLHSNHIADFAFDDGHVQNIQLVDKKALIRNKLQVTNQFRAAGTSRNRYDVTILVNGIPMVQIELKKRGVAIQEAFNQIHRYSKESFNREHSLFKYLQIFVISNGTDTRYFANTTKRDKNSFDFTMNWAKADNKHIKDLADFTATFFEKRTVLSVLLKYSVFDVKNTLLIMRPYQIAATERILEKIQSSYHMKTWSKPEAGGFIWHTTGSGKTLTSFKTAQLATQLPFIDKVLFVVDRKDLDDQTIKEYQRFSPDSVNGSNNTAGLDANLRSDDNKIIVTTIQKLNNFMKIYGQHEVYEQHVVLIFDEAHRSQFGEAQKNIAKKFKYYYKFGFTGTPIFPENAVGSDTTRSVFGTDLHEYILTDAIRDEKVLKFKVDYNDVRPQFKAIETEVDEVKLSALEQKEAFNAPARIAEISKYILRVFDQKTHRRVANGKGFNAMFAVSSVKAAKLYYDELNKQSGKLKIATIFSFAANEAQNAIGEIEDETFEPTALDLSSKEFLEKAMGDYNQHFGTSYSTDSKSFQNYYKDLSARVKAQEIDLLIVVGMFLTGFDAPTLNTLFVDKNLRYHGLIQAFSRTNRIYDATKSFGNIVTFRDLEQNTVEAITLFGDKSTVNAILEKSYDEYLNGYEDEKTGQNQRGYLDVVQELRHKFPDATEIELEADKKEFVKLFGEFLRLDNNLQNYDEFIALQAYQNLDLTDETAVATFKNDYYLDDAQFDELADIQIPNEREVQDYRSTYNDIREWIRREKVANQAEISTVNWDDVVFEVELLNAQEINLDYILELILKTHQANSDEDNLINTVTRAIRASVANRAKEDLILDFIKATELDDIKDNAEIIERFFAYASVAQQKAVDELILSENLKSDAAQRYITNALRNGYASENGTDLTNILPKINPLKPEARLKKQEVFEKVQQLVEKFKNID